jgi:molecular chaperone GrpE
MDPRTDDPKTDDDPTTGEGSEPEEANLPEAEIVEEPPEKLTPEERLTRERDEYYENWMRSQADFKNLRRRQSQVLEAATAATRRELLSGLLLVLDYLDMALLTPVETAEGRNLLQGVKMTRDSMLQFLSEWEVEVIDDTGTFDPALHEAVEMVPDSGEEPGMIVETVRKGYQRGSDVLRHAHVKVAAEPEPESEPESEPEVGESDAEETE